MNGQTFISTTGSGIARAECTGGHWQVDILLEDVTVTCIIRDPVAPDTVYAATRDQGLLRSEDRGQSWRSLGLSDQVLKSVSICRADPDVIYVGAKPPAIFVSRDGGQSWRECEAFRDLRRWFWFTPVEPGDPYVMGLAVSPTNPDRVIAGIEFGGMFRSEDGGQSWAGHLSGTSRDCHSLRFHPTDGDWVYQAGGGWPAAVSSDGGHTWKQPRKGMRLSLYGMACAADPADPSIWYASTAPFMVLPEISKMPRGHFDGEANAFIFRRKGDNPWERLGGGLPRPLSHMAYALVADAPGRLCAGLSNGDVWHTNDYGEHWNQLPFNLGRIQYSMVICGEFN